MKKLGMKSLLEIGCAFGDLLMYAKEDGWEVNGVEISSYASEKARIKVGDYNSIFTGQLEDCSFQKTFDLVVMFDVLEHVPDPISFIRRVRYLIKPNGFAIIDTPNCESIFALLTKEQWVGLNPYHIQLFGKRSLKKLMEQSRMRIVSIYTKHYSLFSLEERWRLQSVLNFKGVNRSFRYLEKLRIPNWICKLLFSRSFGNQWVVTLQPYF